MKINIHDQKCSLKIILASKNNVFLFAQKFVRLSTTPNVHEIEIFILKFPQSHTHLVIIDAVWDIRGPLDWRTNFAASDDPVP